MDEASVAPSRAVSCILDCVPSIDVPDIDVEMHEPPSGNQLRLCISLALLFLNQEEEDILRVLDVNVHFHKTFLSTDGERNSCTSACHPGSWRVIVAQQ